jgi:ferredoxin
MPDLTERVRETALANGADLVGFAPIERFDGAPAALDPRTIFPQTRTVVAVALRHPRGALKAVEEGCYWQAYNCDAYWYLNEVEAPRLLRRIVIFLEGEGHTSVPVHNPFRPRAGRQIRADQPGGPDGMLSLRVVGVAAGLGELGRSKIFLTPQFGPRQRVFAVLTDAELAATPLFEGRICDDCMDCVEACEAGAIGEGERSERLRIGGREFSHAPFDPGACARVHRGEDRCFGPFWMGEEPPGEEPSYHRFLDHRFRHRAICVGRGCLRACLDHLEKAGRVEATFRTPLIEHERWKLNEAPPRREGSDSQ